MQTTIENREVPTTTRLVPPAREVPCRERLSRQLVRGRSRSVSIAEASRDGGSKTGTDDESLSTFMSVRPSLLGVAYRMLHSTTEAEDIVQDVWVRWQTADRSVVRDAAAFLVTTATRLTINVMQSARRRREKPVGPRLLELVDTSADSGLVAERRETLELGLQILLERLSPTERAAYVLREAFSYEFRDIAKVLRLKEANARQVVTRARQHLAHGRRRPVNPTERGRLLEAFIGVARRGDVSSLESLLTSSAVAFARCARSGSRRVSLLPPFGRETTQRGERTNEGGFTFLTRAGKKAGGARPVPICRASPG